MSNTVFSGEFDVTVDDKNRLLIPSDVRRQLDPEKDGESFYAIVGENGRPWLYTEKAFKRLAEDLDLGNLSPVRRAEVTYALFGMSFQIAWDKQGRVLLPEKLIRRAKLVREVTMVGAWTHLELWSRSEWEALTESMQPRLADILQYAQRPRSAGSETVAAG